jgi:hypothetical protein
VPYQLHCSPLATLEAVDELATLLLLLLLLAGRLLLERLLDVAMLDWLD